VDIAASGLWRVVAALKFVQHPLTK
jgi:hypothetical protein